MTTTLNAQRRVLCHRWQRIHPPLRIPDLRAWWQRWLRINPLHQHHHEMTFPNPNSLDWLFVCKCGHTTTDIHQATP